MKKTFLYIILMVITLTVFGQNTYVVTKTTDPDPFTDPYNFVDSLCDPDMYGTLQWAIRKSNDDKAVSVIQFNIPGNGPHEILLNDYLPQIKQPVTIDAETQPGYTAGNPVIILNGQNGVKTGFDAYKALTTIRGIHIKNFINNGINLYQSAYSSVTNCVITAVVNNENSKIPAIGIKVASNYVSISGNTIMTREGTSGSLAPTYGIYFQDANYCTVGGILPGEPNIISGCGNAGIVVIGGSYNKFCRNRIYGNVNAILISSGNEGIQPPVITSYNNGILSGTALSNSTVEIFGSTGAENANEYFVSTVADGNGAWSVGISVGFDYLTALQYDLNSNTSALSNALFTSGFSAGQNCDSALQIGISSSFKQIISDIPLQEKWFKFTAGFASCSIGVTELLTDTSNTISNIYLYRNGCVNPEEIDNSTYSDSLSISAANLNIGSEYFIKVVSETETLNTFKLFYYYETLEEDICDTDCSNMIANPQFSETNITNSNNPFISGVPCWHRGWGTPQIFGSTDKYAGMHAYQYDNDDYNESIYADVNVVSGESYELKFDFAEWKPESNTPELSKFYIVLANGNTFTYYDDAHAGVVTSMTLPYKIVAEVVDNQITESWTPKTINFTSNNNYTRLYIYPKHEYDQDHAGWLKIDNFSLKLTSQELIIANDVNLCRTLMQYTLSAPTPTSGSWSAESDVISSLGEISPNSMTSGDHIFYYTTDDCTRKYRIKVIIHDLPEIYSISQNTFCVNENSESITADPAGGLWSGTGITSGGVFNPSGVGLGSHTLTYTYNDGVCSNSETFTVYVYDIPVQPVISASNNGYGCPGSSVSLVVTEPTGANYTFEWSGPGFPGNITGSSTVVNNINNSNIGYYTVTVTNENGCTNSSQIELLLFPEPVLNPGLSGNCEGANTIFIETPEGFTSFIEITNIMSVSVFSGTYNYQAGGNTIEIPYLAAGEYTMHHHFSDNGTNIICEYNEVFTINSNPIATINGESYTCENNSVLIAGGGTDYYWSTGQTSESVYVTETGTYYVTVFDENGCSDQTNFYTELADEANEITTVFANNDPCSGIFQFIINPGGNTFHAYILNNNTNVYVYTSPDLASQTNTPVPALPIQLLPGNYTLILMSNESSCTYNHNFDIPVSCMDVSIDKIKATCYSSFNGKVEVEISGGTPAYTVYLGQGGNVVSPVYTMLEPGVYTIEVNELFNPAEFFKVIVDDNDPYIINHEEILSSQINYAWLAEDIITSGDITAPVVFEDMTICIGDASDQTFNISHDVTFRNCTVYCATNSYSNIDATQWTVQQENILTLDNSTITSGCPDQLWKGIKLWGDLDENSAHPNDPDLEPAQLIMGNNSNIEFAKTGIFGAYNAVVKITDSRFTNCPTGVELVDFIEAAIPHSTLPNLNPRAYIYRTEFTTDDNYIEIPVSHVNIYQTDKINLKGNYFINSAPGSMLMGTARGKGVNSLNSGFNVIENSHISDIPDLPSSPEDKSRFEGLYYGIYAENYIARTATIRNCDFIDYVEMGAYLKSFTAPTITTNTFTRTQSVPVTKNAGLYLKGCNAYQTENNYFYDGTIGMIVNNSSTYSNEVYRNHFISPLNAFQSYYTNSNADGSAGLFIKCNDYHSNYLQNWIKDGNVKKQQGYKDYQDNNFSISAANIFDPVYLSYPKAFKTDDDYPNTFNYKYWYNMPGDATDITGFTSDNVVTGSINRTYINTEDCPSTLPGTPLIVTPEMEISLLMAETTSLQNILNNLIDGGNTPAALIKVQKLTLKNFNQTCNDFIQMSPYLSDTVLTKFMQTGVSGFDVAKTNVLLANSPLPVNALAELEYMNLPTAYKDLVYQAQTGTNAVVLKQEEIQNVVFEKDLLVNGYVRLGLQNDSLPMVKDSLINFLAADNYFESKCLLIPVLIAEGRYSEAQSQVNILVNMAGKQSPALQAELEEFAELQEIIMTAGTAASADSLPGVVLANISLLEYVAYDPSHRGSSQAQTLLTIAGMDEFEPEMFLPVENRNLRFSTWEEPAAGGSFDLNDMVNVYPNPASKEIWVEYIILKDKPVTKVEIFSIEGKLVLSQAIQNGLGIEKINVSQLSEGSYIVKIGEFTKKINVIK